MPEIISLVVTIILVVFLLWLCTQLPLDAQVKKIVQVLIIVVAIIWCLQELWHPFGPWYIR